MSDSPNITDVREGLLRQRQALIQQFLEVEESLHDLEGSREIEIMDQVQVDVAEELLSRLDDEDRRLLEEIEAALERIESGTYGICADCGRAIGVARLEAEPTARFCVDCASTREGQPAAPA